MRMSYPRLHQVGGEGMPEGVAAHAFGDACSAHSLFHCPPDDGLMDMMPSLLSRLRVLPAVGLEKDPLPAPLSRGVRVLAIEGVRQHDPVPTIGQERHRAPKPNEVARAADQGFPQPAGDKALPPHQVTSGALVASSGLLPYSAAPTARVSSSQAVVSSGIPRGTQSGRGPTRRRLPPLGSGPNSQ